ncbi:MAG: methionyl-tRNA formyltransferase [Deltaproteobacteria bacterium SG8_13]|nr:MAG: methionyl-tRNA formyltransferase [Deltaproteobacteria bacterium SG8_13]
MKNTFRIIFMGTPDYAVPALKAIHRSPHQLALVITQPDRPRGRGRHIIAPPVKQTALELDCEVIQPSQINTPAFAESLRQRKPDLLVVVAYGRILPKSVLDVPRLGAVNVHASLLPKYRGAAPIQWAVINGEKQTGITTIWMDEGMDTGDILLSVPEPIYPGDTAATLHDRLAQLGSEVLLQTLEKLADGTLAPVAQDHDRATLAPMLKKDDGRIDWHQTAEAIECFIRGVLPWPGAFTFFEKQRLKIYRAEVTAHPTESLPGTVIDGFPDELRVAAGSGALIIHEIQGQSGKRLPISEFLRGHPMPPGTILR